MLAEKIRFALCAIFMLSGILILFAAVIGNYRFHTALNRMHAAAMGDSLGKLCICIGLMIYQWGGAEEFKLLFILVFFWMAGPVCAHMLAQLDVTVNHKKEKEVSEDGDSI